MINLCSILLGARLQIDPEISTSSFGGVEAEGGLQRQAFVEDGFPGSI